MNDIEADRALLKSLLEHTKTTQYGLQISYPRAGDVKPHRWFDTKKDRDHFVKYNSNMVREHGGQIELFTREIIMICSDPVKEEKGE